MASRYCIEDEAHAELHSEHGSFREAVRKLEDLAQVPWDEEPNLAPCQSWRTCGRRYEVVEYETQAAPWKELRRVPALEVSAQGVRWDNGLPRD